MFGLDTAEVAAVWRRGYRPMDVYEGNAELREVIELIRNGFFSRGDAGLFGPLLDNLLLHDPYLVLTDFQSYSDCQQQVDRQYADAASWTRMSILNSARSGLFSSDRTIREYCRDIWHVAPVPIRLLSEAEVKGGFLQ
jgi:starch phosphorylase